MYKIYIIKFNDQKWPSWHQMGLIHINMQKGKTRQHIRACKIDLFN